MAKDMSRVDPRAVMALDLYEVADLAARLIRADASASGIPADVVDIPSNVSAPDGGVDGTATGSPRRSIHGLVKEGDTAYQFRTGAFSPASSIADILFTGRGEVKPRIRSCVEGGGTLVVMLFGWDGTARTDSDTLAERFKEALEAKSVALAGARVDVWSLNKIVGAMERFPSIAIGAGAGGGDPAPALAQSHAEWSANADMAPPFRHGRAEDEVVERIRAHLRNSGGGGGDMPVHARVSGQPGSGKTRLVLEATRAGDLAPRVVYAASPSAAEAVAAARGRRAASARPIIVVDECDLESQVGIWNRLRAKKDAGDLVTICNEAGIDRETTKQVRVAGMGDVQIAEILGGYAKGARKDFQAWVDYCRPSPRAAHIVGSGLAASPGDILRAPENVLMWERYIGGGKIAGDEHKDRLTVMLWLSLFTRVGFDAPHERDGMQVAGLIRAHRPEITTRRFTEVVEKLRSIKALQGGPVLHISPRVLHEYLWNRWWDLYGPDGAPRLPPPDWGDDGDVALPTLHSRYCDMLASMKGKRGAERAARALLGRGGPLREGDDPVRPIASELFAAAADAGPDAALGYVEEAVSIALRRGEGLGQHGYAAVTAARRMLRSRGTFSRAARLLQAIAGAGEGEDGGSGGGSVERTLAAEAEDAFCRAFDPAPDAGHAGTPLAERLQVLAGAARGGETRAGDHARRVALRACGAVLRMELYSPAIPHRRGVGSVAAYWRPEDRAGLAAYLRGVLGLLDEAGADAGNSADVRQEAAGAVLGSLAQTALLPEIAGEAVGAAERMRAAGLMDGEVLLAVAESLAVHESGRIDPAAMRGIRAIVDREASAGGLHGRLARRIGSDGCARRGRIGTEANDGEEIARLAVELAEDPAALGAELYWLAGEGADGRNAALLGHELAAHGGWDGRGGRTLGRIEDATRRALARRKEGGGGGHLLAGYLAWACRNRPGEAEGEMDRLLEDEALRGVLPMAAGMSGAVSDRSARRLAQAVSDGRLGAGELERAVRGRALDKVSEQAFWAIVDALAGGPAESPVGAAGAGRRENGGGDTGGPAALDMVYARYVGRQSGAPAQGMPAGAVLDTLLREDVIGGEPGEDARRVSAARWAETARALAGQGGRGAATRLAGAAIGRLGRPGIFKSDAGIAAVAPVLDEIARAHPREVWGIAAPCIGPPLDRRADRVRAWLAGRAGGSAGPGGGGAVPASVILEWAAERPQERPRLVADLLRPPSLDAARDIVARFGRLDGVVDAAMRAFETWLAERPAAAGMDGALARLESMRRGEGDSLVAGWLDRCIGSLRAEAAGMPRAA